MTQKKSSSSKLVSSLKKGARSLLSGKKALAKFGASLPLLALFVEEVRAAQAKGYKPPVELFQALPPEVATELGIQSPEVVQDEKSAQQDTEISLEQKIQNARDSLRAVLEDEISSAQVTAKTNRVDPDSPEAGSYAVRSVLNDEVDYEVAKALEASPNAAEVLAQLPEVSSPQSYANNFPTLNWGGVASSLALTTLTGGGGIGSVVAEATGVEVAGFVIDGYVSGATVFADLNGNFSWDDGEPYARTDDSGRYSFTTKLDLTDIKIVSLGGLDISTQASIKMMVGALGSGYITPVSTLYTEAGGESALHAAGLSLADLKYDPVAQLNGAYPEQAAKMLTISQSLLVTLNNATALVQELTGASQKDAFDSVFNAIEESATGSDGVTNLLTNAGADPAQGAGVSFLKSALIHSGMSAADVSDASGFGYLIKAAASAMAVVNDALLALGNDPAAVKAGESLAWASIGQQTLLTEIQAAAKQFVPGSSEAQATATALNSKFSSSAAESLVATQTAKWAFSKADGSGVTTSADVLSIDAPVGEDDTFATTNVLTNDSASSGSLSLVAVGLLDGRVHNTTAAVSQETQNAIAPATWTLTLDQGPTSTAANYFAGMRLQVTSGLEDGRSMNVEVLSYRVVDGVSMVDVRAPEGVNLSDLSESFDVLISKPLPSDLTVSFDADGLVTVTRSAGGENEIGQYDLIYVAQRSVTNALTSEVTVEGAKVGLLTVYVQPQAPELALTLASPANLNAPTAVAEAFGDSVKTSVVLNLGIEAGSLGVNGSVEIRDLPQGVSFVNGSTPIGYYSAAKDSWILSASAADFSSLNMLVPGNFSGTITPTVIATSRYANLASSTTLDGVTITITPTTDGFKSISAGDATSLDTFFEGALYSQGVEDKSSGLISNASELSKFVQGLRAQLIDADGSEHLALALELPEGWTFGVPNSLGCEYELLSAVAGHGPVLRLFESNGLTLTQILPKLSVLPSSDYATNDVGSAAPSITAHAASFESSLLGTARWNADAVFDQAIQILPVSDSVTLSATTAGWIQEESWNESESVFGVEVTPTVTSSDDVGPDETYYLEVSKADLDLIKVGARAASLDESTIEPGTLSLVNGWYRFKPLSEEGVFKINVPDTLYGADFSVRVRPLGLDVGLASDVAVAPSTNFTTGSAVAVHFAVSEKTFAPTVEFGRVSGYKEDAPIALNKLFVVTPYLERTLDTVTVNILVGENFTVYENGVPPTVLVADADGYVHVPATQLAAYSILPADNFNGSISVAVTASDAKQDGTGAQTGAVLTLPVPIESVIDGFELVEAELVALREELATIEVNTNVALTLFDPAETAIPTTYLGKLERYIELKYLSVKDEGETYSVNLVFSNTDASAVVVKVGGQAVFPSTNSQGSLVFTISQENLESNSLITLEGNTGLFGKSMSLEVFTQDGTNISPVLNLATSSVDLTTDAIAPNAAVGAAFGSEDASGITIPVTLPVDASRAGFEKVGLQIQTTNAALQAGKFTAELVGSNDVLTFQFDTGLSAWRIFDQVANFDQARQIDFSTLKYVPQADYSGRAQFSVASFAKTASDETLASVASNFVVTVKAVAETINFKDQSVANTLLAGSGLEDSPIDLNLGQYFKGFTADRDGSEKITIEVELPKGVSLVKSGVALAPSSVGETTTKTVVVLDEATFADQVALLRLQPSANYSSSSAAGDIITIKARAVESSGESTIIKTAGGSESLSLKFVVTPDADAPLAPVVAKAAATINENTATQALQTDVKAWLKVEDLIRLPSKTSVDANETLSVKLTMTQPGLELFIKSGLSYVQVPSTADGYSVSVSDYSNLYVRGVEYASGAITLTAQTVAKDYWTNSTATPVDTAESSAVSVTVNLKPIANGIDVQVVQANQQTSEDSSGVALNTLIATNATPKDASETLVYKFAITPALKLVATSGSVPTPVASGGKLEYTIAQESLANFKLVPIANFSGQATVEITAGSKESDNSTLFSVNKVSAQITVTAVADAPTLVTPASASGLGSASIPVLASTTDKAITSISGDVAESLSVTISGGNSIKAGDTVTLRSGDWSATLPSNGGAITIDASRLQGLSVETLKDYRGASSLNLTVKATSSETNGSTAAVEGLIKVSVFQAIGSPTIAGSASLTDAKPVQTLFGGDAAPMSLSLPSNAVDLGIGADAMSLLVTSVPGSAYFRVVTKDVDGDITAQKLVGASLGSGGVWLISAADFVGQPGVELQLVDPDASNTGEVYNLGFQAFITDAVAGTSAQSTQQSLSVDYNFGAADLDGLLTDPLVLSMDGSAISSFDAIANRGNINVDLDPTLLGEERVLYWMDGDAGDLTGFGFLVKPDAIFTDGVDLSDLYANFDELIGSLIAKGDTQITAADLSKEFKGEVKVWFDSADSGLLGTVESNELINLSSLNDFSIDVSTQVARAAEAGGVVPLYEAQVGWTKQDGEAVQSSLFSVAVPYLPGQLPQGAAISSTTFVSGPAASITLNAAATYERITPSGVASYQVTNEIPEDLSAGLSFNIALSKAVKAAGAGAAEPTHLVKVYGVPAEGVLSAGAKIAATATESSFWLLTEDQASKAVTVSFPDHFTNAGQPISLSVQAVASLITGTGAAARAVTVAGVESQDATITIAGIADESLIAVNAAEIEALEGGVVSLVGSIPGEALAQVIQSDASEAAFVRFKFALKDEAATDTSFVQSVFIQTGEGEDAVTTTVAQVGGYYEVSAADLANVKVDFAQFFSDSITIELQGVTKQDGTTAVSINTQLVDINFTPVADGVSAVEVVPQAQTIDEGATADARPEITLSADVIDAKESVFFLVKVPANVATAVLSVEGGLELSADDLNQLGLSTAGGVRYYRVDAASGSQGPTYSSDTVRVNLDPYFDGALSYEYCAVSVDPASGAQSDIPSTWESGSITVSPVVNSNAFTATFVDESGNQLLDFSFKEGQSSEWFKPQIELNDPDETYVSELVFNSEDFPGVTLVSRLDEETNTTWYQLQQSGDVTPEAGELTLGLTVTLSDDVAVGSAVTTSALKVLIEKVATQPEFDSGDTSLSVGDGLSLEDLVDSLPLVTEASHGAGELLFYNLSGVPEWLVPSVGTLVADGTYQIAEADMDQLSWSTDRQWVTTPTSVQLGWQAVQMEASNGDSLSTDVLTLSVDLLPVASTVEIAGPASLNVKEGQSLSLDAFYDIRSQGDWSDEQLADTLRIDIGLPSAALKIQYTDVDGQSHTYVGGVQNPLTLTIAEFSSASVQAVDVNYNGAVNISITAQQVFDGEEGVDYFAVPATTQTLGFTLTSVAENLDVSSSVVKAVIAEGDYYALKGFKVTGEDQGVAARETEVVSFTISSKLSLYEMGTTGYVLRTGGVADTKLGLTTYNINNDPAVVAKLNAGKFAVGSPNPTLSASAGDYTVLVKAYAFDPVNSSVLPGLIDSASMALTVRSQAQLPKFNAGQAEVVVEGNTASDIHTVSTLSRIASSDSSEVFTFDANSLEVTSVKINGVAAAANIASLLSLNETTGNVSFDRSSFDFLKSGDVVTYDVAMQVSSQFGSYPVKFQVKVNGENDAPVAVSVIPAQSVVEGAGAITIDLLQGVTDVDSTLALDAASLQIKLGNTVLSLAQNSDAFTLSGHTLTIRPTAAVFDKLGAVTENLQLSWGVKEQLGTGMDLSVARQATVTVQGVNDAPVLLKQVSQTVTEDATSFSIDLLGASLVRDVDTAKSALTIRLDDATAVTALDEHGDAIAIAPGAISLAQDGFTLVIDPRVYDGLATGQTVSISVAYEVTDGTTTKPATANFTIAGRDEGTLFSARVIDGYVQGAKVFYDIDGDNFQDVNETYEVTTDEFGNFSVLIDSATVDLGLGNFVAVGGTDTFTGKAIEGSLVAAAGFEVVTPLTTLISLAQKANPELTVEQVTDQLASALGLDNVDFSTFDAYAEMTNADGNAALGEAVFSAQQAIFTIMQATRAAIDDSATPTAASLSTMATSVLKAIQTVSTDTGDLSLSDRLKLITTESLTDALKDDPLAAQKVSLIADSINTVNDQIIDKYTGLADALSSTDPAAKLLVAQAKAVAGASQDILLAKVNEVAALDSASALDEVQVIDNGQINSVVAEQLSNSSDPDLANAVHTDDDGDDALNLSLKELAAKGSASVIMSGLATDVQGNAQVTVSLSDDASSGITVADLPTIVGKDANGNVIAADKLNVTLSVNSVEQLSNVAGLANGADLGSFGFDRTSIDLGDQQALDSLLRSTTLSTDLASVREDMTLDTVDMASAANIDQVQASQLIGAGLDFAGNDTVTLDVDTAVSGTHLNNSLKELSKLGVDAVMVSGATAVNVDLGIDSWHLGATGITKFETGFDVTLNVHQAQFNEVADIASSLSAAGIDHLNVYSSELGSGGLSSLLGMLEGKLDITLTVDSQQSAGNLSNIIDIVDGGLDLLKGGSLAPGATWGDLITTLHDAGLSNVALANTPNVTINDDLSAALYESGMMHALPEANITLHANTAVLNTSLKAMAELGVDSVTSSQDKVYVELGIKPEDLGTVADLGDLFSAFGLDQEGDHNLFNGHEAGLVIDQTTFNSLSEAAISNLVGQLSQLGFTEIDVMGANANAGATVYAIETPVAQTPVLSTVEILGSNNLGDLASVFDPDILHKVTK